MKRTIACVVLIASFFGVLYLHSHLLKDVPHSRVEVVGIDEQSFPDIMKDADPVWENDRMVFKAPNLFTAQQIQTALLQSGIEKNQFKVLDYSWATALVKQSKTLWVFVGAIELLCLLIHLAWQQINSEIRRAKAALKTQYGSTYLNDSSTRLLSKAILFILGVFLGIVIIRFLMTWEVVLPSTLLPQDSLFHFTHYQQWCASTFPAEVLSEYGMVLLHQLKIFHIDVMLECGLLIILAFLTGKNFPKMEGK